MSKLPDDSPHANFEDIVASLGVANRQILLSVFYCNQEKLYRKVPRGNYN